MEIALGDEFHSPPPLSLSGVDRENKLSRSNCSIWNVILDDNNLYGFGVVCTKSVNVLDHLFAHCMS